MVWSKHQFEREVCRQMVELESIRKRIVPDADVLERIDRLEESHRSILRKLNECFPASSAVNQRTLVSSSKTVVRTRRRFKWKQSSLAATSQKPIVSPSASKKDGKGCMPPLGQKCGTCGKILLSSILAGDEVVLQNQGWHHRKCAKLSRIYRKPQFRN